MLLSIAITLVVLLIPVASLRLYYILPYGNSSHKHRSKNKRTRPAHIMIVLGSGGHTTEMLMMLQNLDITKFTRRTYIVSSGDNFSAERAEVFEKALVAQAIETGTTAKQLSGSKYSIVPVRRARKVHQSIYTAPFSSFLCLLHCILLFCLGTQSSKPAVASTESSSAEDWPSHIPDLILTNGPATGVILVFASLVIRFFGLDSLLSLRVASSSSDHKVVGMMRTIYVESWARVKRLSLSGQILLPLVDRFIVQWESLLPATKGKGLYLSGLVALPKPLAN